MKILLENLVHNAIDRVIYNKSNAVALVGEPGAGKSFVAQYIAAELLGNLSNNQNYLVLDATICGIEEVRDLQKQLAYSVPGDEEIRRVVVIEHFDTFGHEAQNALLKTLEEPPLNTMLIITVDNLYGVLPTIVSRVQVVRIPPASYITAEKFFNNVDSNELRRAYLMSDGLVGLMASLLDGQNDHRLVAAILQAKELLQLPKYKRLAYIESLTKKSELPVKEITDGIIRVLEASYRQALQHKSSPETLKVSYTRVKLAIEAAEDVNKGLNQKLALTRLFLAL